jgi:hypothetical protein
MWEVYSHSIFVDGAWVVCFYWDHFRPRISGVSAGRINLLKCYFVCYRFVREPKNGYRVTDRSPAIVVLRSRRSAPSARRDQRQGEGSDVRRVARGPVPCNRA